MGDATKGLVLVTGGSGFLGAHCVIQCLNAGYSVRTTVRSLSREKDVLAMLKNGDAKNLDKLTFAVADLSKDAGWKDVVDGCTYVLHVASPFPPGNTKDENELIIPAREGTLRVLRAARDGGIKRVVVTSSFGAIGYGHVEPKEPFTEKTWTNVKGSDVNAYLKSKTLAERAAWDFIEKEGRGLELATVNPTAIFGPVLGSDFAPSILLIQRMLNGTMPGCPKVYFGIVDVRDVADLHLRAMIDPKAKGERFVATAPPLMSIQQISLSLRERMGDVAKRSPTRILPDFVLRLIALFDAEVAMIIPELGSIKHISNDKAKNLLGWQPRSNVEAIVATAESLLKFGLV